MNIASIGTAAAITSMILFDFSSISCDSTMPESRMVRKNRIIWPICAVSARSLGRSSRRALGEPTRRPAAARGDRRWQAAPRNKLRPAVTVSSPSCERRRPAADRRTAGQDARTGGPRAVEQRFTLRGDVAVGSRVADEFDQLPRRRLPAPAVSRALADALEFGRRHDHGDRRPLGLGRDARADAAEHAAEQQREQRARAGRR